MPFKKHKEAKEQRAQDVRDERAQIEKQFDASIMKAAEMVDPAAKILALRGVASNISTQIKSESDAITSTAKNKGIKTELASKGVTYAAGASVLVFAGPVGWIGFPILAAGVIGSDIIGRKRKNAVAKKLRLELNDHIENMKDMNGLVSEMINVTVENNVEAISDSPLYGRVMALPGISDIFAEAAAKHIAAVKAAPVAEEAPPAKEEGKINPTQKEETSEL